MKYRTITSTVTGIDGTSGLVTGSQTTTTELASGLTTGAQKVETVSLSGVLNYGGTWCLGVPQTVTTTASHTLAGGGAITRSYGLSWDSSLCRPTQQQLEPGNGAWQVTVALGYDGFGNVNARTVIGVGLAGRQTLIGYGARGQFPTTVTNPLGQVSTQTWNYGLGVPTSATDPNGLSVAWDYDAFGRPTLETLPDGTSTLSSRAACFGSCNSAVRMAVQSQRRNTSGIAFQTNTLYFDQFERPLYDYRQQASGGTSIAANVWRDPRGRITRSFVPFFAGMAHNGYATTSYDVLDRPTAETLYTAADVFDRQTTFSHEGLSTLITDPRSNSTRRWSTAWGDLVRIGDAAGGTTSHEFDAFGNLLRVIDAYGNVSSAASYNVRGMRTALSDMNLGSWSFTPNALGEVVSQTDAKGQTVGMLYDPLGRMISRTEAEGTSTWTWGTSAAARNIGRLQAVAGPGYGESFAYTAAGQLATRSINSGSVYQIDYQYNDIGALHALTYPASAGGPRYKVKYGYAYGHVASVREFTGDVDGLVLWSQAMVDPQGNPIDESYGNGLRVVSGFSPLTGQIEYRQAGVGGSTTNRQDLTFGWDKAGNLSQRQDLAQGLSEVFYYDALNRIDYSTLNGTQNLDVTLDLIGNVTARSDVGSYSYHATKKHAVTAAGGSNYTYDANGNMTGRSNASGATAVTWMSYNLPYSIVFTPAGGGGGGGGGGSAPVTEPINWTSLYCASVGASGAIWNNCGDWNGSGLSTQSFTGDGAISFKPNDTGLKPYVNAMELCLTADGSTGHYCLKVGAGYVAAYVGSSWRADIIVSTSDTLKLSVESNVVKYYKNGTLFYTAPEAPTFPLRARFGSGYSGYGTSEASITYGGSAGGGTNLALNKPATSEGAPCASNEGPEKAFNGSVGGGWSDKWCSLNATQWLQVDLQSIQNVSQFVVKHAQAGGEESYYNTRDFNIQVSSDGSNWTTAVTVSGNTAAVTTHPVTTSGRYVRLSIVTPTQSGNTAARIYELEVIGGMAPPAATPLSAQFLYTPDRQYFRQNAAYTNGNSTTEYVGGVMEIVSENGTTQFRHMVPAGNGMVILTRSSAGSEYRYLTRDHLGSTSLITNGSGVPVMTQSFAAYGARRQANWQAGTPDWNAIAGATRRGYTGHTMLDNLNLVHMNGRVYDPAIGRFMSADPIADGLGEAGGFNRYSYVRNNPMAFTDALGFSGNNQCLQAGCRPRADPPPKPEVVPQPRGWTAPPTGTLINRPGYIPASSVSCSGKCSGSGSGGYWAKRDITEQEQIGDHVTVIGRTQMIWVPYDTGFVSDFQRTYNEGRSLLDADTPGVRFGEFARDATDYALTGIAAALIAIDVANTVVSPGPDVGIIGLGILSTRGAAEKVTATIVGRSVGAREAMWSGKKISNELAETLGVGRKELGRAVERIKQGWGMRGDHNVTIGRATGDVYDSKTGELLGNVLDEIGR